MWRVMAMGENRATIGEYENGNEAHEAAKEASLSGDRRWERVEVKDGYKSDAIYYQGRCYLFTPHCGAYVEQSTREHLGLVRCFCGWARSGGDGYAELLAMGETIEPEEY